MNQGRKDLKNLLKNGVWWSAADAFTTPFIIPFALALGATNVVVGLVNSLQNLGLLLSQIPGSELVWVLKKRRALNNACEFISKCSWLLIVAIPFSPDFSLTMLLVAVFISSFFANLSYPAWASFIADVIPKGVRGRYLANRNMWMGLVSIVIMLSVGFYLDLFPKENLFGFSSIFLFGFAAGIVSILYFSRIRGSKLRLPEHTFRDYFRLDRDFRRYLTFISYFNFTYMIASPFFTVYMLVNLHMDYAAYVLFSAISAFASLASQKHWGNIVDRFGERPTMFIAIVGVALVPFSYIFINPYNLFLLIPVQILSGVAWAGVWLINFNMFLDTTKAEKRIVQTADYNIITTIPLIIAPVVGGYIAENVTFVLSGIPLLFMIATVLRLSSLPLLKKIKEPHVKRDYAPDHVFRVFVSIHPVRGVIHEIRTINKEMRRLKNGL